MTNISGYVTKPFDYTELIEMIVNALKEGKRTAILKSIPNYPLSLYERQLA